jgi:hypothetical protein
MFEFVLILILKLPSLVKRGEDVRGLEHGLNKH